MAIIKPKLSPFIKWVGGKRDVINKHLHRYFPLNYNCYLEPFSGGAAVLYYLQPNQAIINDLNYELITTYQVIKTNVNALMKKLDQFHDQHSEEFYYEIRKQKFSKKIDIAARFIYLNKTGFNGLYRVNKNNEFNVPFNKKSKEKLKLYDQENLMNLHNFFNQNQIEFFNLDYQRIMEKAQPGDFVFCDPPYDFNPDVIGFNAYNQNSFTQNDQINLANHLKALDQKNVMWMHTNHNTPLIRELYKDFVIIPIQTNRNINSKGANRKNTGEEVIIMNYDKNINQYYENLEETNIEINDLIDHKKVIKYVAQEEIKLNTLNYIIDNDSEQVINKIKILFQTHPDAFQVIPFLLAIKHEDIKKNKPIRLRKDQEFVDLKELLKNEDDLIYLFKESGLLEFIIEGKIRNFVDYLTGVEVGKDTNARKNRFGKKFENEIETLLKNAFENYPNIKIEKQIKTKNISEINSTNLDLKNSLAEIKKLDFLVIDSSNQKYVLIEISHYNTGGSKINETGKSYLNIIKEIENYQDTYQFIWVTDGYGMNDINKETLNEHLSKKTICTTKDLIKVVKEKLNLE